MDSVRHPGDQGFLFSLKKVVDAKTLSSKKVMPHGGRRRLIGVCRRKMLVQDIVNRSDWPEMGHKGDTARPPGKTIVRRFENLYPAPELARNNTKLYQKEVKSEFWHGSAMLSTTFENRNAKNIPKKQIPSEFCCMEALQSGFVRHWEWLVASGRCILSFPDFISPRKIIFLYLKIHGTMWNWYENTSGG